MGKCHEQYSTTLFHRPLVDDIVRREIFYSSIQDSCSIVALPTGSLAIPSKSIRQAYICADVQLRSGKLLATTMACAQLCDLLSGSAAQLLQQVQGRPWPRVASYKAVAENQRPAAARGPESRSEKISDHNHTKTQLTTKRNRPSTTHNPRYSRNHGRLAREVC